jgi:hypothetical protein
MVVFHHWISGKPTSVFHTTNPSATAVTPTKLRRPQAAAARKPKANNPTISERIPVTGPGHAVFRM